MPTEIPNIKEAIDSLYGACAAEQQEKSVYKMASD